MFRASERCQQEKRKTINGEDILFAMSTLGFDNYVDPLKQYLTKYREVRMLYNFLTIYQALAESEKCIHFLFDKSYQKINTIANENWNPIVWLKVLLNFENLCMILSNSF